MRGKKAREIRKKYGVKHVRQAGRIHVTKEETQRERARKRWRQKLKMATRIRSKK